MALTHHEKKEINAKIVYYGPAQSGKTANLKYIYEKMKPEYRGKLKYLNTSSGTMLFFDFMRPDQIGVQDYNVRFHIYTLPGEVTDFALWKTVLKGVDGLVFVADSEPYKIPDNVQMYEKLDEYLRSLGMDVKDIPCIFQCNKQDAAGATTPDELKEIFHGTANPIIPASVLNGEGVLNTLSTIVKMVLQKLREKPIDTERETPLAKDYPMPEEEGILAEPGEEKPQGAPADEEETVPVPMTCETLQAESFVEATSDLAEEDEIEEEPGPYESAFLSEGVPLAPEQELENSFVPSTEIPFGLDYCSDELKGFRQTEETAAATGPAEAVPVSMEVDFAGDAEQIAPGHLRIPLTVRHGQDSKTITFTLKLSLEAEDQ